MVSGMLIAEDLLLLLTDDSSGRLSAPAQQVDAGLGGANLAELAMMNKVDLTAASDLGRTGRIVVRDTSPAGDEVLDAALRTLATLQGKKPAAVITPLGKHLRRILYERLTGRGVVRAGQGKILGIFPASRWPVTDVGHEIEVRGQLASALTGTEPDPRTAVLIALMRALRKERDLVDPRQCALSKRQLKARAEQIAAGNWAADAVRKVIDDQMSAAAGAIAATGAS